MNILFLTYTEISLRKGNVRAVAMLYALADAGHRVDLIAPYADLPEHPHIHALVDMKNDPVGRRRLRTAARRAVKRNAYDAVHGVDEAVFFAMRLCRRKKIPLIYDAIRCFSGKAAAPPATAHRLFPKKVQRMESRVLERASVIFSPSSRLSADLRDLHPAARVVQLEDIAAQPLYPKRSSDPAAFAALSGKARDRIVLCCALRGHAVEFRELLMTARKVIEAVPDAVFLFRGIRRKTAERMAANLDIADHCVFLPANDPEIFLAALDRVGVILMVPPGRRRYIHPQVFTLLQADAPLVAVHDAVYDDVLTEKTSVQVLPNTESIVEGLLRVIHEPLFQLAVTLEGQQLVADHHAYSSFKHKVRMTYRDRIK